MAVLSNIRADFPGFSLKIVEHSRFLPELQEKGHLSS
jgi:hypothetical protein